MPPGSAAQDGENDHRADRQRREQSEVECRPWGFRPVNQVLRLGRIRRRWRFQQDPARLAPGCNDIARSIWGMAGLVDGIYKLMRARSISRRSFLGSLAALPLLPRLAHAFGDSARFIPAVAQHGSHWNARLSGLRRLTWELQRRTSVEVVPDARPFPLNSPRLFQYPFLYWGGEGEPPALSSEDVENLRRYLTFGGFMLADANDGSNGTGFDRGFRRELARVLPRSPLVPLPSSHVLFKSYFMLDSAVGRLLNKPQLEACNLGRRAAVIYSQNDLAGAWSRDDSGDYEFEVSPGGEQQREQAFRLGINVCMYALCLDYKDDAVHLPLIMNKRR